MCNSNKENLQVGRFLVCTSLFDFDLIQGSVSRKLGITKWPFRDRHRFTREMNTSSLDNTNNVDSSKAEHQSTAPHHRCSDKTADRADSCSPSEYQFDIETDQNLLSAATTQGSTPDNNACEATTHGLRKTSVRWAHFSENYLDGDEFSVEEVDTASSPSGSDAELLDCANTYDDHSLLLIGGGDGDGELDRDNANELLRIAPFAQWCPHADGGCGGGGDEAMRDPALEWISPAADAESLGCFCAAAEHDGARTGDCGDRGEVRAACGADTR
jgi:hypothetical protein